MLLGLYGAFEVWNAIRYGIVTLPLGGRRWALALTFIREENSSGFYTALAIWVAFGAFFLGIVAWLGRTLFLRNRSEQEAAFNPILRGLEEAAPSGLRPLWYALCFAAACFFIYAAAA